MGESRRTRGRWIVERACNLVAPKIKKNNAIRTDSDVSFLQQTTRLENETIRD